MSALHALMAEFASADALLAAAKRARESNRAASMSTTWVSPPIIRQ